MFGDMHTLISAHAHIRIQNKTKLFLAMELCGGGELYERITRKGTYSEKDAALILIQVLSRVIWKVYDVAKA